jgi:type IV secretion system protein VirB10
MKARSRELSELEKLQAQLAAEKLKRALEARRSKVTFDHVVPISNETTSNEKKEYSSANIDKAENFERSSRDDINRQDDKKAFLATSSSTETTLPELIRPLVSRYALLAGTIIPGLLMTGLNSDLPGEIIGQVSENVFDSASGRHLLIPQGTKVLGHYDSRITYGQQRLLIVWSRLILPSGRSIVLMNMPGTDQGGASGLKDYVDNHYGRLATGIILSSVIGAAAQMAQGQNFSTYNPSFDQLAVQGFAQNTNQVGQRLVDRALNIQPTIKIRAGTRFTVFVNKDMRLEPISK